MTAQDSPIDRLAIHIDLERVRHDLHRLIETASPEHLRRPTAGTRWSNEQLLWHMVFGFLIVRRLLPLVRTFARLPSGCSRIFARGLDSATSPFDWANYVGGVMGSRIFHGARLLRLADRTFDFLERRLDRESDDGLARGMSFPVRWDPFFRERMTVGQVYRYGIEHYDFHRRQLTLEQHAHQEPTPTP